MGDFTPCTYDILPLNWFESYITAILQRDIREIAHIEGLTVLPRLLSL